MKKLLLRDLESVSWCVTRPSRAVGVCLTALVVLVLFPGWLASRTLGASSFGGPKAVTSVTSFDFGDIYAGEIISQIFVIRNEGDAELQVKEFKGG